jgi:hypothetical protein
MMFMTCYSLSILTARTVVRARPPRASYLVLPLTALHQSLKDLERAEQVPRCTLDFVCRQTLAIDEAARMTRGWWKTKRARVLVLLGPELGRNTATANQQHWSCASKPKRQRRLYQSFPSRPSLALTQDDCPRGGLFHTSIDPGTFGPFQLVWTPYPRRT